MYGNTPEAKQVGFYKPTKDANIYVDERGSKAFFPTTAPDPEPELSPTWLYDHFYTECRGDKGAYRRMFTKEGGVGISTRYTYIRTVFGVRGGSTSTIRIANRDNTTAFAFLGGNGTNGWAMDAGLQYGSTYEDWALFLRTQGGVVSSQGRGQEAERFAPDQRIEVEFFVVQDSTTLNIHDADGDNDNVVAVIARGRDVSDGTMQTKTFVMDIARKGWYRDGMNYESAEYIRRTAGINLRHTVSLAQITMNLNDGSYFRGTTIEDTLVGSSYATRRAQTSTDVARICEWPGSPADVVQVVNGAVNIQY